MSEIRRFDSEQAAAAFYLETQRVRGRSTTDYERRAGCPRVDGDREDRALRGLVTYDAEATHRAIERALEGIADEWCGALLVCLGWGALVDVPNGHERSIRAGPWMGRAEAAGLPQRWCRLPAHLTRHGLWVRRQQFRESLGREAVLDGEAIEAWSAIETGSFGERAEAERYLRTNGIEEEHMAGLLVGWKEIAGHMRRGEKLVRSWEEEGLPVIRPPGGGVCAFASDLDDWLRSWLRAQPREGGEGSSEGSAESAA